MAWHRDGAWAIGDEVVSRAIAEVQRRRRVAIEQTAWPRTARCPASVASGNKKFLVKDNSFVISMVPQLQTRSENVFVRSTGAPQLRLLYARTEFTAGWVKLSGDVQSVIDDTAKLK